MKTPQYVLDFEAGLKVREVYTERIVPVPSVRDALGQHLTARVLLRAGYVSRPPYHPERSSP